MTHRRRWLLAALVLAAVWLGSGRYTARVGFKYYWLSLQEGSICAIWVLAEQRPKHWRPYLGGFYTAPRYTIRWAPALVTQLNLQYLYIPLWIPLAALGAGAGLHAARARFRRRSDRCPACAYDLTGAATGKCPECGFTLTPRDTEPVAALSRSDP